MLDRDRERAVAIGTRAVALASELGDVEVLAASEMVVGTALLVSDDPSGRPHLERALKLAEDAWLDEIQALVHLNFGSSYGEQYRFAEAEADLKRGIDFTHANDLDSSGRYMSAWMAITHLFRGNLAEASEVSTHLLALDSLSAASRVMALVALARVRVRRGDPGAAPLLDEALMLARRTGTLQRLAPVHAARAEMAWYAGDLGMVRAEATAAFDLASNRRHAWHTGEFLYWRRRAGEAMAVPDWIAAPYALQLAGRWQDAAEAWRARGCRYEEARALAEGDLAAQRRALRIFDELGAGPAASALRRQMRATGITGIPRGPRSGTRGNAFGLTGREMTILEFLVRKASNEGIARTLFISPKTVDHHVSSILAKLGAASRHVAAEIALREGLCAKDGERPIAK